MPHNHILVDDDNRFIIDGLTRQITNLTGNRPSVMQFDHNSEKLTFQMPRTMEGHDMSLCDEVKILYKNTGSGTSASNRPVVADVESINDVTIDESDNGHITFSWTIPEFATIYSGTIVFQFKFVCNGDIEADLPKFKLYTEQYSFIEVRPSLDISENLNAQFPNLIDEINARLRAFERELHDIPTAINLSALDTEGKIVETYADSSTKTTTMEFDADGNPIKITDGDGNETVLTW